MSICWVSQERKELIVEVDTGKSTGETLRSDRTRLDGLTRRVQADKAKLAQRIAKLTASERALVLEIERLKLKGAPPNSYRTSYNWSSISFQRVCLLIQFGVDF